MFAGTLIMDAQAKKELLKKLQQDILLLEGFRMPAPREQTSGGLGLVEAAFPNGVFPTGAIHEFLATRPEYAAACGGFIAGLLAQLNANNGIFLWISTSPTVFPPSLKAFGISPDQVIFVDLNREKDVLWATEEALKCKGVSAVIAELREITFAQSRRLQLAVETSRVTGFVLRTDPRKISTTACVARWLIAPISSESEGKLPGISFPRWKVELQRVRNGKPGSWELTWTGQEFRSAETGSVIPVIQPERRKTG